MKVSRPACRVRQRRIRLVLPNGRRPMMKPRTVCGSLMRWNADEKQKRHDPLRGHAFLCGRSNLSDRGNGLFLARLQCLGPASEKAGLASRGEEGRVLVADFSAAQVGVVGAKLPDFLQDQLVRPAAAAAD